jgi:hypothetical protein
MDAKTVQSVTPEHIFQVGLGFWSSKTLLSAIELGLFTHLAKLPGTLEELQRRLELHPRAARDFLDALVALGFLDRREGVYRNTAATDLFLDKAKPSYIGGMLEMSNARLFKFWNNLTEGLRTGQLQNEAKGSGQSFFKAVYADPSRLKEFLKAMTGMSHLTNLAVARQFPWPDHKSVVDMGAAQGDLVVQIARPRPADLRLRREFTATVDCLEPDQGRRAAERRPKARLIGSELNQGRDTMGSTDISDSQAGWASALDDAPALASPVLGGLTRRWQRPQVALNRSC